MYIYNNPSTRELDIMSMLSVHSRLERFDSAGKLSMLTC